MGSTKLTHDNSFACTDKKHKVFNFRLIMELSAALYLIFRTLSLTLFSIINVCVWSNTAASKFFFFHQKIVQCCLIHLRRYNAYMQFIVYWYYTVTQELSECMSFACRTYFQISWGKLAPVCLINPQDESFNCMRISFPWGPLN